MRFRVALCMVSLVAMVAAGLGTTGVANATGSRRWWAPYTCTGGEIGSGTYANIRVTGACTVAADAVVRDFGSVEVAPGATLDAQGAPSTIFVGGDVFASAGSLLELGCQPNPPGHMTAHPCTTDPSGSSDIAINGSIFALGANTVALNGIRVRGDVILIGGGDQAGNAWPIKNNTIGRSLLVAGATPEWLGVLLNHVGGSVTLLHVTIAPGETIDVTLNTIGRNLNCAGLAPAVVPGVIPGEVNTVGHQATGQCASFV